MRLLHYLIPILLLTETVCSQNSDFDQKFDIRSLSGIQVNDIKEDSLGFLWIGTNEGLYRYDGYNLKLYRPNSNVIGSSIISKIYFTKHGDMWVGTKGGLLKYNKNRDQFITFKRDHNNLASINANVINSIAEDNSGNIWIALSKGGVDQFVKKTKTFRHFLKSDSTGLLSNDISDVHVDNDNNLWISTWDHGVNKLDLKDSSNLDPRNAKFESYTNPIKLPGKLVVRFIAEDPLSKDLYIATAGRGLFRYDKTTDSFKSTRIGELENCSLYSSYFISAHKALITSDKGVKLVNLETSRVESCPESLCEFTGPVYSVFVNTQNITWLGTYNGLITHVKKKIKHHRVSQNENGSDNIMALCKQGQFLWTGTWGDGLYLKNEKNEKSIKINADNTLLKHVWDIKLVNDKWLFVATAKGLVRLEVNNISFRNSFKETNFRSEAPFTSFTKNKSGNTWIGTWRGGLYQIDAKTNRVKKYKKFSTESDYVQAIHLDGNKQLWIGTIHSGLIRLSDLDGVVKSKIYASETSMAGLSSDFVSVIFEDDAQKLWIGTGDGGINILDLKTEQISWIVKGDRNLPSNTIRAVTQDNLGDIWVSSKSGISKFDHKKIFINYTEDDGLEHMEFNPNAVMRSDSLLYFGNSKGYDVFNPSDLIFRKDPPKVFITDFKIFDKSIEPGELYDGVAILTRPINELESITLPYKINNITFEFSALNFSNPKREIFAYSLEGFNDTWIYTNASHRQVSYSNLVPGDYIFKVKTGRNSDVGEEQGRIIKIHIIPPIWQTIWFKGVAAAAFLILLALLHWSRLVRLRNQKTLFKKLAQERVEIIESKNELLERKNLEIKNQALKLHEADQSKIDFFANISHEFKTPLMLIAGPITRLLESNEMAEKDSLRMIDRNSKRLLRLIEQVMDFSKMEAGSLTLEPESGDFLKFMKDIAASFDYQAKVKNIAFQFYFEDEPCFCYFDRDKVEKIIYNLLSNAFKVTPPDGRITIRIGMLQGNGNPSSNSIHIEIFNSGKGISKEELSNLFTRFYRTKSYSDGTGIGLSLTKSLVELHGGTITVKSEANEGTYFYVTLPVKKSDPLDRIEEKNVRRYSTTSTSEFTELADIPQSESEQPERILKPGANTILILEDDEDMRLFIASLLTPLYNVVEAANGEEALKLSNQFQPDLIISDMMMPGMDGYQFLRAVKKDSRISHIPVILLTARASMDARLKGLEEGADDYITKPFNEKLVLARVKNLIARMQRAKERFSSDIDLEPKQITIASLDEKFVHDLLNIVEKNIENPQFGSDVICQEIGVSRSHLYSKVKALTDLSVNEFIKTVRLKRAAVLLSQDQLQVNEVAYKVGFSDRSHFSKSFLKHFGVSPAQYQRENHSAIL